MRFLGVAAIALACGLSSANGAAAKTKVSVKTTTYGISANTGLGLIKAMDRKGPKHGFTTRAIAQTAYTVGWRFTWERRGSECRLAGADGSLDMVYTFPQANRPMSADLQRRWDRFMVGVRKHEETHGTIARTMVATAEGSVKGLRVARDPSCHAAQAEALRRIGRVYDRYEAKQVAFDQREHRDGGNVEKLLRGLRGNE